MSTSFEVFHDIASLASDAVLKACGQAPSTGSISNPLMTLSGGPHDAVIIFVGQQLASSTLRSGQPAISKLNSLLEAAAGSVVMPYTSSQAPVQHLVTASLQEAGIAPQVLGCGSEPIDLAAGVALALAERDSGSASTVLLLCAQAGAGIGSEVAQLQAVQRAVDDAQLGPGGSLFIYTSSGRVEGQTRRLLQATAAANYTGFGQYQYCGELCRTQVMWLEGMLVLLFLALASCSGLMCLLVLDTPTRFDAAKEGAPSNNN
ncbi:MAG: hypothetical protein WDW38_007568 [Sanguina aurantia]